MKITHWVKLMTAICLFILLWVHSSLETNAEDNQALVSYQEEWIPIECDKEIVCDSVTGYNFYFSIPEDKTICIFGKYGGFSVSTTSFQLYTEDNKLILIGKSLKDATLFESSPISLKKGNYHLCLSNHFQTASLKTINTQGCWEKEPNNDRSTANEIAVNTEVQGVFHDTSDGDCYFFELDKDMDVTMEISGEAYGINCYWSAFLYKNESLEGTVSATAGAFDVEEKNRSASAVSRTIPLTKGKYYLHCGGPIDSRYTIIVHASVQNNVESFVSRLYNVALNREPDAAGLADWTNRLTSGQAQAVNIVQGIMCSPEYLNKGKSNGEIVNDCYKAMLGRDADEGGYKDWVTKLDNGMTVEAIFAGFVGSQEFANLCNSYGIQPGTYAVTDPRDQNQGVTAYVSRLYTQALGRGYDPAGLSDWCGRILANPSRENIVDVAATGFFHSQEFQNKGLNNEEYVKVLYRTFLGRECDPNGLADWVGQLDRGEKTRDEILPGFANSQEFSNIMAQYGL